MMRIALTYVIIFGCSMLFWGCDGGPKADLVIHNGAIYTVDDAMPIAGMVAVTGDKIVAVGNSDDAQKWIGDQTKVIDLNGKAMTPGLIEGHGHFIGLGKAKMRLNLMTTNNYDDMIAMVAEAVKTTAPGEWILGRGWHQSKWDKAPDPEVRGFQTHQALSAVSPDNPVFLRHASGHAAIANAKAMEVAGITRSTKVEGDGEVIKDARGNPTGILTENAMELVGNHVPKSTPEILSKAMELAMDASLEHGITTFHDAGTVEKEINVFKKFLNEGKLKMRLWAMLESELDGVYNHEFLNRWYESGPEIGLGNNFLTIRSIKIHADGALGSRGAWLLEEYLDRPGHYGHETVPMSEVYNTSANALKAGFQVCTHAIGDRTNREVLDMYEKAFKENPENAKDSRFRIEHAQHLSADDIGRFAEMGVIPSMQGIHMASDRPWAIDRLGKERIVEGAYVWRKLIDSGAVVINGTDVPVEPISAIASFYASVTRQTLAGDPPGGYEPDQKMTRAEALKSYTLNAAYAGFEEDIKGSIEVGKLADFAVFSQDIMTVDDSALLDTKVEMTIVGGKLMYERK